MPGTFSRSEIKGAEAQSGTTIHGWGSVVFGIPFLIAGVFIFLISVGIIPVDKKDIHAPLWVLSACGAMFGLPGAWLLVHGARGLSRKTRLNEGKKIRPEMPWLWDYDWEPLGISENKVKKVLGAFVAALFLLLFLSPFNWWAFFSGQGEFLLYLVVGLFDSIALVVLGNAFYKLFQLLKYGDSRLRFGDFPFYLGQTAQMTLEGLPADMNKLKLELRCVEEAYETRGSGKNRSQQVVCYRRYGEERNLDPSEFPQNGSLKMEWELPEDTELSSRLSERPALFWEIEIEAATPGIDYHSRFLLPVYAKN